MTNAGGTSGEATIRSLGEKIDEVLGPLLPPGTPYALLDFPNHANVGDSAIWLGEKGWLHRQGLRLVYACDVATYSRRRLAARLGDGVILLHGGGNLGDFWLEHQQFREQVIQDFPGHRIIQLPQTIYFMDEWGVGEARRTFDAHHNLTLLCRDRPSLDFARKQFAAPSLLCPDMAFAVGPLERAGPPVKDILWLGRTDAESAALPVPALGANVERIDWLEEEPTPVRERNQALSRQVERDPPDGSSVLDPLIDTYDILASERLRRGCQILSRGKVVVTDRLHGHVLCLLLGIPHVLLDNVYGKLRAFSETWTRNCPFARPAGSPAEALRLAEEFVGSRS
ncbi:MAG TPA: polysaccharide pyruvyl transferase family protein [Gemmataceae bacterium]|nr:polysaccharide pyruvyl transferase family protein [Gemmataceae bacterium]